MWPSVIDLTMYIVSCLWTSQHVCTHVYTRYHPGYHHAHPCCIVRLLTEIKTRRKKCLSIKIAVIFCIYWIISNNSLYQLFVPFWGRRNSRIFIVERMDRGDFPLSGGANIKLIAYVVVDKNASKVWKKSILKTLQLHSCSNNRQAKKNIMVTWMCRFSKRENCM